jgi:hypothetical protein
MNVIIVINTYTNLGFDYIAIHFYHSMKSL